MQKRITIWIVGWAILYIIFYRIIPYYADKYQGCGLHEDVYAQSFRALILDKFNDPKNHNLQTIIYRDNDYKEKSMTFTHEFDGMYNFIDAGDSIIKKVNTIHYKVTNKATGKDTVFKFHTMCKDSLKKQRLL
ncbi:MAG TPA: hypothetical protein VIM77_12420 [Mucilaginibacter sp.]